MTPLRDATLLVFAPMTWDAPHARKHALVASAHARGLRAVYVEPPNSRSRYAPGGGRPSLFRRGEPVATGEGPFALSVPKKWSLGPLRLGLSRRAMEGPQGRWLAEATSRLGATRRPLVAVVTSARWEPLLRDIRFDALVYDKNDEFEILRGWLSEAEYRAREAALIARADLLIAPSRRLLEAGRAGRSDVPARLIRNGVEWEAFEKGRAAPVPELDGVAAKVVGFMGTIAGFTDVPLLAEAAAAYPDCRFEIVGPVQSRVDVSALRAQPNVRLWGAVPFARVPAIVDRFDVCLIPFRAGPVSESLCPVKFFEYLALGKAIVSTPMPELRDLAPLCYMGREDFVEKVGRALAEDDPALAQKRREAGRAHGWDRLFDQLLDALPAPA